MVITTNIDGDRIAQLHDSGPWSRVFDRILELCYPLKLSGNRRKAKSLEMRKSMRDRLGSVSYTHLDVYKRQGVLCLLSVFTGAVQYMNRSECLFFGKQTAALLRLTYSVLTSSTSFASGQSRKLTRSAARPFPNGTALQGSAGGPSINAAIPPAHLPVRTYASNHRKTLIYDFSLKRGYRGGGKHPAPRRRPRL